MNLAQEVEIKLKKYEDLNDDNSTVLQISAVPHYKVFAV